MMMGKSNDDQSCHCHDGPLSMRSFWVKKEKTDICMVSINAWASVFQLHLTTNQHGKRSSSNDACAGCFYNNAHPPNRKVLCINDDMHFGTRSTKLTKHTHHNPYWMIDIMRVTLPFPCV